MPKQPKKKIKEQAPQGAASVEEALTGAAAETSVQEQTTPENPPPETQTENPPEKTPEEIAAMDELEKTARPFVRGDIIIAKGFLGETILGIVLQDEKNGHALVCPIYPGMGLHLEVEGSYRAELEELPTE